MGDAVEGGPDPRDFLLAGTALGVFSAFAVDAGVNAVQAQSQRRPAPSGPPNIVYFVVTAAAFWAGPIQGISMLLRHRG